MNKYKKTKIARNRLDSRLSKFPNASEFAPPQAGWIRAVRDALGMTAAQLGQRMGVKGSSVGEFESNEKSDGIRLSTLKRAAEAMSCTFVYAFIPRGSLEHTVQERARKISSSRHQRINQTMALEDQRVHESQLAYEDEIEMLVGSSQLWSDEVIKK